MNTKKKRFVTGKRLIYRRFLALTLAGSLLLPGLVLIQSQPVEASFIVDMASGVVGKLRYTATVAEIIVSLLSGSGAAVTDTAWLNQLNNAFGVESTLATATGTDGTIGAMYEAGLFSVDNAGHFIDNGLANAIRSVPEYSNMGISDLFATTSTDMELGAWQVADGATNIGEAASAGIALGTIGQAGLAVTAGVGLGVLANKFIDFAYKKMASSVPLSTDTSNCPANMLMASAYSVSHPEWYYPDPYRVYIYYPAGTTPTIQGGYANNNIGTVGVLNYSGGSKTVQYRINTGTANSTAPNRTAIADPFASIQTMPVDHVNFPRWSTNQELSDLTASLRSNPPAGSSPDVITKDGNARPSTSSTNNQDLMDPVNWPSIRPVDELQEPDTGITPIPWDNYMDQTQIFNYNTTNNNTTVNQGDTYQEFITQYITTPTEVPDIQIPDYNPTVPEQPTPNPKEELTSEVIQDNTDYMTTPGLKDVFPFSIPWDIAGLFNVFSTNNREAPVITFPIVSELFGIDEEITIDLSPYDDVAALLRVLELIAFGLGLAFVTRYLIGAGG